MTEKQLLEAVRAMAHLFGYRSYHTHRSERSEPGWPDLVLARPFGVRVDAGADVLFVELKAERGTITGAQAEWLDLLAAGGHPVYVWRPETWRSGEVEAILRRRDVDPVSRWRPANGRWRDRDHPLGRGTAPRGEAGGGRREARKA